MNTPPDKSRMAEKLRAQAEQRFLERDPNSVSPGDQETDHLSMEQLIHEIKLGKIEREIQSEALIKSQGETADAVEQCTELFDSAPTSYFKFNRDGKILAVNFAGARLAGAERDNVVDTNFKPLLSLLDGVRFGDYLGRLFDGGEKESFDVTIATEGREPIQVIVEAVVSADGTEARANIFDVSERHKAAADRAELVAKLQIALDEVKLLSGVLPICVACKKIRDENGRWTEVDVYIERHSEAQFNQGLCPDCFPEFIQ